MPVASALTPPVEPEKPRRILPPDPQLEEPEPPAPEPVAPEPATRDRRDPAGRADPGRPGARAADPRRTVVRPPDQSRAGRHARTRRSRPGRHAGGRRGRAADLLQRRRGRRRPGGRGRTCSGRGADRWGGAGAARHRPQPPPGDLVDPPGDPTRHRCRPGIGRRHRPGLDERHRGRAAGPPGRGSRPGHRRAAGPRRHHRPRGRGHDPGQRGVRPASAETPERDRASVPARRPDNHPETMGSDQRPIASYVARSAAATMPRGAAPSTS